MIKKWWHDKIAYQIYPKSFCDLNGDGIGDLRGVISKLDYLKDLGVDIVWLSPIYKSPFADQGYDISDYYSIDPSFGTMEDMEELIAEAKKRDMYIVMDLVINHCSDEHEWFVKAMEDPEGEYGKYFYIERGKDGKPPYNWRSYFGGSAWEKIPGTDLYYLHSFHKKQPDLNWENPKVREELYRMINWWLDKGLAGFRIDAIINIKKALPFQDYEPDRNDGLVSIEKMIENAQGIGEFLDEMKRETFEKYDAFTVGEVFGIKPDQLADFIGDNGYFSSMFDFRAHLFGASDKGWYDRPRITPEDYKQCCFQSQRAMDEIGFLSNIIENHDEPRGVSYYLPEGENTEEAKKLLAGAYFMLKGLPFIYQGQELGMENIEFSSIQEVDDIATLDQYQVALEKGYSEKEALKIINLYSRDNSRTPFQWCNEVNGGFTTGTPWLKVNPNYTRINAKDQVGREDSVFSFYQKLIRLRKHQDYKDTLVYGEMVPIFEEQKNLMAYYRRSANQCLLVLANIQKDEQYVALNQPYQKCLLNNMEEIRQQGEGILLKGYQFLILKM